MSIPKRQKVEEDKRWGAHDDQARREVQDESTKRQKIEEDMKWGAAESRKAPPSLKDWIVPKPKVADGDARRRMNDALTSFGKNNLFPYQIEAIIWGIIKNARGIFNLEMGMGKTPVGLVLAKIFTVFRCLFITPRGKVKDFQDAAPIWIGEKLTEIKKGTDFSKPGFYIVSRDTGKAMDLGEGWDIIIMDEAHDMRHPTTIIYKEYSKLFHQAKHAVLLTGTPEYGYCRDWWALLNCLDEKRFPSYKKFTEAYCGGKMKKGVWEDRGRTRQKELKAILKEYVITMTVDTDMVRHIVRLNAGTGYRRKRKFGPEGYQETREIRMETNLKKLPYALEDIYRRLLVLPKGRSAIIFVHHTAILEAVCDYLKSKEISHISVNGKVKKDKRQGLLQPVCDGLIRVGVLSYGTCSTGLNLTPEISEVFILELPDAYNELRQAQGRADRFGKKHTVNSYWMIANGSHDESLLAKFEKFEKGLDRNSYKRSLGH